MGTAVDVTSPDLYAAGPPHELLAELRRTEPVVWQDYAPHAGFWAVLRHGDVIKVARDPETFSANVGGVVLEDLPEEQLEMLRDMLLAMDPPRHDWYRRPLTERFKARVMAGLEERVREICRSVLSGVEGDVEFVHEVAARLPAQVIGELMGIPTEDWARIHRLAERNTSGQDPDYAGADTEELSANVEMGMYAFEFAARRRAEPPREDLTSFILGSDFNGHPMDDVDFARFFVQLVTAANDTTKTMASSGILALLQHPEQLAELRADPSLIPGAIEEILRWANPLHYFRRTALQDTELGGSRISKGDKVAMWYTSANRDEAVFDDPQRFDIHRHPNPHLAFGIGQHFCLGVHLARLEGRVFFEELLASFPTIELAGEPVRLRSNLNNAYKAVPLRLSRG